MVAITQLFPQKQDRLQEERGPAPLAKLKELHAEAVETARLANLLGRSLYAGIGLSVLGVLTVGMSVEMNPAPQLVWCGFVAAISLAMLLAYRHAMKHPFEHEALKDFAKDLSAILLFAGFAWGAGAFLALPSGTSALPAILFASVPAVIIAYLLRDREALFLFLAPVACLSALAAVMKPFAGGAWLGLAIIVVGAAIAGATLLYDRVTGEESKPAMLSLP